MSDLNADEERAGEAAEKLAVGIKACRSVVKNYRSMLGEHPMFNAALNRRPANDRN